MTDRSSPERESPVNTRSLRALWLLVVAWMVGCGDAADYSVSGQLFSARGPVPGARVALSSDPKRSTLSDETGHFQLNEVPLGLHTLTATYEENGEAISEQVAVDVRGDTAIESLQLPVPVKLTASLGELSPGTSRVVLNWTKAFKQGFREYKIYRHTTSGLDETTGTLVHVTTDLDETSFVSAEAPLKTFYYRVFVLNDFGKIGGSNVASQFTDAYRPDPSLTLGQKVEAVVYSGQPPHLFHFDAEAQHLYLVEHFGDINLTVFDATQSTVYAQVPRTIMMSGHPLLLPSRGAERVNLRVSILDSSFIQKADYSVKVSPLIPEAPVVLEPGTPHTLQMAVGATRVRYIDAVAGTRYRLTTVSTAGGAPSSPETLTFVSVFGADVGAPYVWDKDVGLRTSPQTFEFTATRTERLTLAVVAAYWWDPTQVTLSLSTIP